MMMDVAIGQNWATWVPGRRQWLLATVVRQKDGRATLKYDERYEISSGYDELTVDESTLLNEPNLFRIVPTA